MTAETATVAATAAEPSGPWILESTTLHAPSEPRRRVADNYWKRLRDVVLVLEASGEIASPPSAGDFRKPMLEMIRLFDVSSELMPSEPQWRFADAYWKRLMEEIRLSWVNSELISTPPVGPTANSGPGSEVPSSSCEFSPGIVEFLEIAGGRNVMLKDALNDLDEAAAEARDEGFPIPSDRALVNARRLLLAMYRLSPRRFEVYPTPDGEVAIDAPGGRGRSVLLLCDSGGGALCLVNMHGRHRRARYSDTSLLPDGFVREALDQLAPWDELAA